MKIAALDLGTNTFRLLISDTANGELKKIYRETNITRLGEGLSEENIIGEPAIERSVRILKKYKLLSDQHGVSKIYAAGTSAFRKAVNSDNLISYLREQTGINIDVITGDEEALLTIKGVLGTMISAPESFYHLDIGGGSTEISLIEAGNIEYSQSIELGVVSLAEEYRIKRNPTDDITHNVREILSDKLSIESNSKRTLPLVATSGTPIVVACILNSINQFDASKVNNMKISFEDVLKVKNMLIKDCDNNDLEKYGDILRGREDLIVPGTVILSETMKYLGNDCMIISESGLLEGLSFIDN